MNKEFVNNGEYLNSNPHGEQKSHYAIETSHILDDVSEILRDLSADKVSLQEAVDWLSDGHFSRTGDWDEMNQMVTDFVFNTLIVKFFGKPNNF